MSEPRRRRFPLAVDMVGGRRVAVRKAFETLPKVGKRPRLGTVAAVCVRPVTRGLARLGCWSGAVFGGSARFGGGQGFSRGQSLRRFRDLAVPRAVVGLAGRTDAAVREPVAAMAVRRTLLAPGGARHGQGRIDQVRLVGPGHPVRPLLLP